MPVHAFLKGGHAVLMVQKHEKSPFLADVRQPPEGQCDRSLARGAWDIAPPREPSPGFDPGLNSVAAWGHRRDGSFGGRFPGTSCQATIVLSLRGRKIHSSRQGFDQVSAYGESSRRVRSDSCGCTYFDSVIEVAE